MNESIYELGVHIIPDLKDKEVNAILDGITKEIEGKGGKVIEQDNPKAIELAYTIKHGTDAPYEKINEALFSIIKFELGPEHVKEFDTYMSEIKDVLRYILFKTVRESTRVSENILKELDKSEKPNDKQEQEKDITGETTEELPEDIAEEKDDKVAEEQEEQTEEKEEAILKNNN